MDEYMRFRHLFRHQYGFQLRWQLVKELVDRLPETYHRFAARIRDFGQWLKTVDGEDGGR
jgi:hypothetical protein